jgi:hypothetical protein
MTEHRLQLATYSHGLTAQGLERTAYSTPLYSKPLTVNPLQ